MTLGSAICSQRLQITAAKVGPLDVEMPVISIIVYVDRAFDEAYVMGIGHALRDLLQPPRSFTFKLELLTRLGYTHATKKSWPRGLTSTELYRCEVKKKVN